MSGSIKAYSNDKIAMTILAVAFVLFAMSWYTLLLIFFGFLIVLAVLEIGA